MSLYLYIHIYIYTCSIISTLITASCRLTAAHRIDTKPFSDPSLISSCQEYIIYTYINQHRNICVHVFQCIYTYIYIYMYNVKKIQLVCIIYTQDNWRSCMKSTIGSFEYIYIKASAHIACSTAGIARILHVNPSACANKSIDIYVYMYISIYIYI